MHKGTIEIDIFKAEYTFKYESACHALPNGDPGYPSYSELSLDFIYQTQEDGSQERFEKTSLTVKELAMIYEACAEAGYQQCN